MAQVNETSKRSEYHGEVMTLASSLADLPHGGQILMEDKTFDGVKVHLAELCERVPRKPDWQALQTLCRCGFFCLSCTWKGLDNAYKHLTLLAMGCGHPAP